MIVLWLQCFFIWRKTCLVSNTWLFNIFNHFFFLFLSSQFHVTKGFVRLWGIRNFLYPVNETINRWLEYTGWPDDIWLMLLAIHLYNHTRSSTEITTLENSFFTARKSTSISILFAVFQLWFVVLENYLKILTINAAGEFLFSPFDCWYNNTITK